jgi:hypothetical protein
MILAFKPQFVEPILNGSKIHTIREDKSNRWAPGKQIHFATGVRTKDYNQFKLGDCRSYQRVRMSYDWGDIITISINGRELLPHEREVFAHNDGFENWQAFFDWFYPIIKATEDNYYKAKVIHWTDFRY